MEGVEILKPKLADLPSIVALWHQQHDYHLNLDPNFYAPNSPELDREARKYFKQAIKSNQPNILVAKLTGGIVGFITFEKHPSTSPQKDIAYYGSNIRRYGEVIDLFVVDSARGSSVGTLLMKRAEEYFQKEGIPQMMVEVSAPNEGALRFYRRLDFSDRQTLLFKKI